MISKEIDLLKKKQRKIASKKRLILNQSININNEFLKTTLSNLEFFKSSNIVASFISIKTEISTDFINKTILNFGKTLSLPSMVETNGDVLIFRKYSFEDQLVEGHYGVKEPVNTEELLPDIIFVPCLAFDSHGYRLGYGGGYYDKTISYLQSLNHNFNTIGFAYNDQKIDSVAHNNLDKKLNYILTENQLYEIL